MPPASPTPVNPGVYFSTLSTTIVRIRDEFKSVKDENDYLTTMGGAAFLMAAPFNLSIDQANAIVAALGNHAALGAVYIGGPPPASALDYRSNGIPLWLGQ